VFSLLLFFILSAAHRLVKEEVSKNTIQPPSCGFSHLQFSIVEIDEGKRIQKGSNRVIGIFKLT